MQSIIMALAEGDNSLPENFAAAVTFWKDFHEQSEYLDDDALARAITNAQFRNEGFFDGDRYLGKMTMPLAALAAIYDSSAGFEENRPYAIRVAQAFARSMVSVEVKGTALVDAILAFDLEDAPELQQIVARRFR